MMAKREFLDPARRLVDEVADGLCGLGRYAGRGRLSEADGVKSLAHVTVVVPTAQSGRRLRLALARFAAANGWGGLLPPATVMPSTLLGSGTGGQGVASEAEELAVLAQILLEVDLAEYGALFPRVPAERSVRWALDLASSLLGIGAVLGERAMLAQDVTCDDEVERWCDIARLERLFLEKLGGKGLVSHLAARKASAERGCTEDAVSEFVLAGLVDAQPALQDYLVHSARPVTVLVHADETDAGKFDAWGRPTEFFAAAIDPAAVFPAPTPVVEADDIAAFFRAVRPSDALPALAVCDADMFPELEGAFQNRFSEEELVLRNPARESVAHSSLGRILASIFALADGAGYEALSAFLRMGDVARWLAWEMGESPERIAQFIGALDSVQNAHLPQTVDDVIAGARSGGWRAEERESLEGLARVVECVKAELPDPFRFLRKMFASVTLDERNPGDRELVAAAEKVRELREAVASPTIPERLRRPLFVKLLKSATYMLEPVAANVLAADGWLEVPWCDEDELVIAGFNEGCVPESVVGHPFLPDGLRAKLGLMTNDARAKRDSFIFAEAVRCRARGAVRVHLHQLARDKNVMKPSRILFGGIADSDLPSLARRLYVVTKGNEGVPPKELPPAWRLRLPFPPEERTERAAISVTALDQYLKCPFNFFLQETFGAASNDRAQELDALAFGTLCHETLDRFAKHGPKDSTRPEEIADYLEQEARSILADYGTKHAAIIDLQGEAAIARLRGFATIQAARRKAGWRICAAEKKLTCTIKGSATVLRGKVDRIDENERTGELAIIDYKTWDRLRTDVDSLQLPIYRAMVQCTPEYGARAADAKAFYCVLAKRAEDTVFDEAHACGPGDQSAAEDRVVKLLDRLARGVFYPPSNGDWRDVYGGLIWKSPEEGIDLEWLADQKRRLGA